MNVITTTDGAALMSTLSTSMGGIKGLLYDLDIATAALQKARQEIPATRRGRDPDYRRFLLARLRNLRGCVAKAQDDLAQAQRLAAQRRAQAAQVGSLAPHQVAHCIKTLSQVEAWLTRLNPGKPTEDDYHARLLMRDEVAGVRDLLLNAGVHSIAISH